MSDSFSVLSANIGSMYLWSTKDKLPHFLGQMYGSLFNYGRTPTPGLEAFAQLVHQRQPTLVCLQEVYSATHQKSAQDTELERMIGPGYKWFISGASGDNKVILVHKDAINGHGAEQIMTVGGIPCGIAYKLHKPLVWIASVHLRYSNVVERAQQLEELLRWADSKKEPVLLAGDFNTHSAWASPEKQRAAHQTLQLLLESGFENVSESVDCTWRWGRYLPTAGRIKLDHFFGRGVKAVEEPFALREHLRGWMDHLALFGPKFVVYQ